MFHLVKDTSSEIENNLINVRYLRDSIFSWWLNIVLLVVVVGSFGYFLYASYGTATPIELQKIPFEPNLWQNATRNVPSTEYGQIPQTETGSSVQGYSRRTGAAGL